MPVRILFAGSGEFGVPALRRMLDDGHQVLRVFTQPARPAGRGRRMTPTPVAASAAQWGLPVCETADLNAEPLPEADLLVVIAFGQKIAAHAVNHCRWKAVNLHASRLPRYRGAAPIHWAIMRGEATTGNSIIRLADRMDAGAVLAMSEFGIAPTETTGELHDRLALDGANLLARVIDDLRQGRAVETPQDDALATSAPKLSRQNAWLDFRQNAKDVARRINGLSPWPMAHVRIGEAGPQLGLCRARACDDTSRSAPAGTVMPPFLMACGQGCVEVLEVQPESAKRMTAAEYLAGHALAEGTLLLSDPPPAA